ncbi:MAG: ATP-binding cassette domain-containing protein [Treponema phagedenis]|uniref:ribosomal protection-like ABC-F family protein n=1 Tax=Treponema phagedenis TaxID=162 RepID=UPI0011E7FD5A|nr:ATP-binding cassette domain-containing protein [Treponema phagedenis]QEJ95101.1 ABC-F family ATP-binding cassette domain-containing protein [Treponema phagedenis]QEK03737.1 ABC-F family ATP-binding cassette domain-containing protein [Treponema phagedenis]
MIKIENVEKQFADRKLFFIELLQIFSDEKIALIGDNGVGKTTLMKMISGQDSDFSGNIDITMNIQFVEKTLSDKLTATAVISDHNSTDSLSPGEAYQIRLFSAFENNTFLLMDEPTANLDFAAKERLIHKLNTRKQGFLLISHDRDFIEKTCSKIFELREEKIFVYKGSYHSYLEERANQKKFAQGEYEKYTKETERLSKMVDELTVRRDKIRTTPKRFGNSEARLHKMGGQSNKKKVDNRIKSVRSRIEQLAVKKKPIEEKKIVLSIPDHEKIHSKILIEGKKIRKSFGEKLIFDQADFYIDNTSKVALIGKNGSGKTTLLQMIINGEQIKKHPRLKIGYFGQLNQNLHFEKSIVENIRLTSIYDETLIRVLLARLGFRGDRVGERVKNLSDGERAKVQLAKMVSGDFNFLIFDEPTNYLEISAIEVLEEILQNYDRPFIFVSHDKAFINNVANRLLIIKNHKIKTITGNLKEYEKSDPPNINKMVLQFRMTEIFSKLSMEIPKEERVRLEAAYEELLKKLKNN